MGRVRLEIVADFGPRRGQTVSGIVVEPVYEEILRAGLNKLKLKKKDGLLLVLRDRYQGSRVLDRNASLEPLLRDGATVVLTTERPAVRLPRPPRWPWPGAQAECAAGGAQEAAAAAEGCEQEGAAQEEEVCEEVAASPLEVPANQTEAGAAVEAAAGRAAGPATGAAGAGGWCGPWPDLGGGALALLRRAVAGAGGFLEKDMGGYLAFDYHTCSASELPAMFPDPQALPRKGEARLLAAVRRECRGLLVCGATGRVLARRLPKFFNADELEETRAEVLPPGGLATRKLDGSLVSPFLLNGTVRWAGKSAIVPEVESFVASRSAFRKAEELVRKGFTPIFEWCEAGPPVGVITHDESRLVLLAVRDMATGEFWPYERLQTQECEVVETVPFEELSALQSRTRSQVGVEGVVVAWPDLGRLVKLKTAWWVALAAAQKRGQGQAALALLGALQALPLSSVPAPAVWQAALAGEDDQMAQVFGQLPRAAEATLRAFAKGVDRGVRLLDEELREWSECAREASEADLAAVAGGWPINLLMSYQRRAPTAERELRKFLAKAAVAGKVRMLEALTGAAWDGNGQVMELCGHLGDFEPAPHDLAAHVLESYLPRKLEEYLGEPISEETAVHVDRLYEPSEGKIKGLWERFINSGIIDLRVDLQPRAKVFNFHNGDADFAHWQVQFGPNDSCPRSSKSKEGDRRGAFAGVLVRTGIDVAFAQLREAMELSFKTQKVVKLDPSPSRLSHIYVDLDGVLVDFAAGFQKDFGAIPDPKARWQYIERTPGFYERLPWMEGARQLWDHLLQTGLPLTILTGVPEGALGQRSAEEKAAWVARELGAVALETCLSREKALRSGPGRLLVDDRRHPAWEAEGGRQVLHASVPETLAALAELGLGRRFAAERSQVVLVERLTEELQSARAEAEAVAVDVEWPPDKAGAPPSRAALLQLAFSPKRAFVIDVLAWDDELEAWVRALFESDLPKLVFGPGDAERLQMRLRGAVDLQQGSQSLAAQARRAGLVLQKPKELQAADWSQRPLRDEQLVYAATDALVLLQLPRPSAAEHSTQRQSTTALTQSSSRQATIEYTGVFLTADARQKLLRRVPPRFPQVLADHMTLAWRPSSARGLAVGAAVRLRVVGLGQDDLIQAVAVETVEQQPRSGHVTLSLRPEASAAEAQALAFAPLDEPFSVDGTLGASVLLAGADREQLPPPLLARLRALAEGGQPGASERFEGVTDGQRYVLHVAAEELGLEHRSEGKKGTAQRKLILTVPKRWKKPKSCTEGERVVVKDPKKFAALFGDVPGLRLHGRARPGGVAWEPGVEAPAALLGALAEDRSAAAEACESERLVVILRGFPGSGKSSLASLLQRRASADIASADEFFVGTDSLQEAHELCRQSFMQSLATGRSLIVVDNTNVKRADYAFYRSKAEAAGCAVAVLELACPSTAELERLRRRSLHGVPGGAVGAMWARWEHDPAALRLEPYLPQELLPWLREQNLLDRPPHTHLVMSKGPFISVPPAMRAEFLERFSSEWGRHHISEIGRPQAFRLFFDVDGLPLEQLLPALPSLRLLVGGALLVTGTAEPPAPGHHIFVPSRIVTSAEAAELRLRWLEAAPELRPHVDGQLYRNPQLRLLGSRKISKEGVDMGRVHEVVGRFDTAWEPGGGSWDWSEVSIHP